MPELGSGSVLVPTLSAPSPRGLSRRESMAALSNAIYGPYVPAFLDLLAWSEGTATSPATKNDGYDVIVTGIDGKPEIFTDYSHHPFDHWPHPTSARRESKLIARADAEHCTIYSDAAGRYQIILPTWLSLEHVLGEMYGKKLGTDFSPLAQDIAAVELIRERKDSQGVTALSWLLAGRIAVAIHLCSAVWASLPGSTAGQGGKSLPSCLAKWDILTHPATLDEHAPAATTQV